MTFYRTRECPGCQAIEDALDDLAIAYNAVVLEKGDDLPAELANRTPPVLVDEHQVIQGSRDILDHLSRLADFKKQWYKYQSDACYCDEDE